MHLEESAEFLSYGCTGCCVFKNPIVIAVLGVQIENQAYPVNVEALHTVFTPYGFVQKIACFEKNNTWQVKSKLIVVGILCDKQMQVLMLLVLTAVHGAMKQMREQGHEQECVLFHCNTCCCKS